MKMSPMHFDMLSETLTTRFTAADRVAMWSRYEARGLSPMRFRWDLLGSSGFDTRVLYDSGLNDDHIDTALRRILPIKTDANSQAEAYICADCDHVGYGGWNCDNCGSHELARS